MARWEPDASGRLTRAALELYAAHGYEQTTVADIAERAGVTERTYFRYFADKREVLFDASGGLQELVVGTIASAPLTLSPIETVGVAMESAASVLQERREFARQRASVIAANPSLQERELLKLALLGAAAAEALRARGVPEDASALAAETGIMVFKIGFEKWVAEEELGEFPLLIRGALDGLRSLTAAT